MSGRQQKRAASRSASARVAATAADAAERSRVEALLFESPGCAECRDPDCSVGRARLTTEAEAAKAAAAAAAAAVEARLAAMDAESPDERRWAKWKAEHPDAANATANADAAATFASTAKAAAASAASLKKCSHCGGSRPASAFSAVQLKLKGKRQCRDCIEPTCAVCGMHDLEGRERLLSAVLITRPRPASDILVSAHCPCATLLGGTLNQSTHPPSITGLSSDLCTLLDSFCDKCHHGGVVVRCSGCGRVYHELCANDVTAATLTENRTTAAFPVIIQSCQSCAPTKAPISHLRASATPTATSSADAVSAPSSAADSTPSKAAAAPSDSAADSSSTPPFSAGPVAASVTIEPTATAVHVVASAQPSPTATATAAGASAAATSSPAAAAAGDSSSSSAAGLKKCGLCQRSLPDSDYSSSQLKAKAKRQCKVCVAALQSAKDRLPPSKALVVPQKVGSRLNFSIQCLDNAIESERIRGLGDIGSLLFECEESGIHLHLEASVVARVLSLLRDGQAAGLRAIALEFVLLIACRPQLIGPLLDAGAVSALLATLRRPGLDEDGRVKCAQALRRVAESSRASCDSLLAAGALATFMPLLTPDASDDFCSLLFATLNLLLQGRAPSEVAGALPRLGAVLVDASARPNLLVCALRALQHAVHYRPDEHFGAWADAVFAAAAGLPQRLVQLLVDDRPDVRADSQLLMVYLFVTPSLKTQPLFDCGLLENLSLLLRGENDDDVLRACKVTSLAVLTPPYARLLVESAEVSQRVLQLLATSSGETLQTAAVFVVHAMWHRDRQITRRLVDEYRFLPPLVAALRRAIHSSDQAVTLCCLRAVANLLVVGDAEADDDDRGVNPYIEPIDWLGAFELAGPLQKHSSAEMADLAKQVFSYFIPNDCD